MTIQKNANYEQHMISDDLVLRDSFQVVHDNTDNLQNQIDLIVKALSDTESFAEFRSEILGKFL